MKYCNKLSIHSSRVEIATSFLLALLFFFAIPHNGLTLFICLFLPIVQWFWMLLVIRNQIRQHCIGKAIAVLFANMLSLGILSLIPVIMLNYLPKVEDPVMNVDDSKQFGIYVASYACINPVVFDSISPDLDVWAQYSNNYISYQSKEDIVVTPRFVSYSCIIRNEFLYQKMVQMEYGLDWQGYYRCDSDGKNYVFAEYGVTAPAIKDTIVMHIIDYKDHYQTVDSLTFVRTSDLLVPDWDVCQKTIRRHIPKSYKQRFLDRVYNDYFWNRILK